MFRLCDWTLVFVSQTIVLSAALWKNVFLLNVLNVQCLLSESSVDPSNEHIRQSRSKRSLLIKDKRTRGVSKRGGSSLRSYRDMVQIHRSRFLPWRKLSEWQSETRKRCLLVRHTLGILHLAAELGPHQEKKTLGSLFCSVTVAYCSTCLKAILEFATLCAAATTTCCSNKPFYSKTSTTSGNWPLVPSAGVWRLPHPATPSPVKVAFHVLEWDDHLTNCCCLRFSTHCENKTKSCSCCSSLVHIKCQSIPRVSQPPSWRLC